MMADFLLYILVYCCCCCSTTWIVQGIFCIPSSAFTVRCHFFFVSIVEHQLHWKISIFPFFRSLFAMLNTLTADGSHGNEQQWRRSMFHVRSERGMKKKPHKHWRTERRTKQRKKAKQIDTQHCVLLFQFKIVVRFVVYGGIFISAILKSVLFFFISQWMSWSFASSIRTHDTKKGKKNTIQNTKYKIRNQIWYHDFSWYLNNNVHCILWIVANQKGMNVKYERVKWFSFAIAIAPLWLKVESLFNHFIGVDTHMDSNRTDVLISRHFTMTFFSRSRSFFVLQLNGPRHGN